MEQTIGLNAAQMDFLQLLAHIKTTEELEELSQVVSDYYARKAEDEFLAKKMAEIEISPEINELFDALRLTPEEAADERTRWILGLDRR